MNEIWIHAFYGLGVMLAVGFTGWLYSLYRSNVNIVDSLWSLMFLAAAAVYAYQADSYTERSMLLLAIVALWALRLSVFLAIRNHGQPEDRRYREIRGNNEPNYAFKSLYIIFGLQALLAWIISAPLLLSLSSGVAPGWIETIAVLVWITGFTFETVADLQLYRFKSNPDNDGKVLRSGLWAWSRHPNYFGEFLIWWAFYLFALSAGGWWTIFSPLLLTLLLFKVSGVSLMEKDIGERRAKYRDYIESTNAFFPGRPKQQRSTLREGEQA